MTLAEFQGESLGYGRGVVLEDVTLRLSAGERVVLLGRSGAGKTTLLNALYDRMTASGVRVALAPQDHALVPQLSVLRNALMGRLDDHGWAYNLVTLIRPRRTERAAIADVLAQVGLGDQIDRAVGTLSGGQKQRTALARALYRNGQVLIADEPVSAVDETRAAALLQLMRDSVGTSVLALHDVGLARAFATRLIGIRAGRIVLDAAPDQITPEQIAALYAV
ncbi:MAG: phosphonate ABC transporter ATP-binding protein [Paracoccus denitrificans]|nr:MAG: phosphonate ABC transporter ATP-binding protein [Paracoccus denitrificans]PZO83880.1 MAG: phosphonate ABC transporter ATP-binding protein [Paracoccus denitrificans]